MSVCENYTELQTREKDELFVELFDLKDKKKLIDKRIKELEAGYKSDTVGLMEDKFFITSTNIKFSFKTSKRIGSVDTKKMEANGIDVDSYRKPSTSIVTLRRDT